MSCKGTVVMRRRITIHENGEIELRKKYRYIWEAMIFRISRPLSESKAGAR